MSEVLHKEVSPEQLVDLPIIGKQPENEREEKYLREICEYEFYNLEEPGLLNRFAYGEAGNQRNFTLMHGGKYKLPRFIARHIESRSTPIWSWRPNGLGGMEKKLTGNKPRFRLSVVFN